MGHVFISYSKQHRDLTIELAAFLSAAGLDVWWDQELVARGPFDTQIYEQLETADAVVVLWTPSAVTSEWVHREAMKGLERDMLVNVIAEGVRQSELPEPFRRHHRHRPYNRDLILRDVLAVREGRLLLDPKVDALPQDPAPSALLQAKYGVVAFLDSDGAKNNLLCWCRASSRAAAGRLVHGPGGVGKTRLLIEVATALRAEGWSAGFYNKPGEGEDEAVRDRRKMAMGHLVRGATDNGLLIVLDYAEARRHEVAELSRLIRLRRSASGRPVRLLLLARSAGDWWNELHEEVAEIEHLFRGAAGRPDAIELRPWACFPDRAQLFRSSVATLRRALPSTNPNAATSTLAVADAVPECVAQNERPVRPLTIQLAALLHVYGKAPTPDETTVDALLGQVLGLERAHWRKLLGALSDDDVRDLNRATAQVTVVQGVANGRDAEHLLMADTFYQGTRTARVHIDPVLRRAKRLYGNRTHILQLEPDLIGEHLVAGIVDHDLITGCTYWIHQLSEAEQAARVSELLRVLDRATMPEHGPLADSARDALVTATASVSGIFPSVVVDVARQSSGMLPEALSIAATLMETEDLMVLADEIPSNTVRLGRCARSVAEIISARLADAEQLLTRKGLSEAELEHLDQYGTAQHNEAARQLMAGRNEVAEAKARTAVAVRRHLAGLGVAGAQQELARSLKNYGDCLRALNRSKEALEASEAALAIWRSLAVTTPESMQAALSAATNQAVQIDAAQALVAARRARLNADDLDRLSWLATALDNLSVRLSDAGRFKEALSASQESLALRRLLAAADPDLYQQELAFSLNNISADFDHLGLHDEAMVTSTEAVELFRVLSEIEPDMFLPDLAASLHNLSMRQSSAKHAGKAHAMALEALAINQSLAEVSPDAHLPEVASSLDWASVCCDMQGAHEEALAYSEAAVDLHRSLSGDDPVKYRGGLASALNNHSLILSKFSKAGSNSGFSDEALAASAEAIAIYRELIIVSPAYAIDLAKALGGHVLLLLEIDQLGDAHEAAREALLILRPFFADNRDGLRTLAASLVDDYLASIIHEGC